MGGALDTSKIEQSNPKVGRSTVTNTLSQEDSATSVEIRPTSLKIETYFCGRFNYADCDPAYGPKFIETKNIGR